jgi:dsRNA-specific ribonuclease
MDAAWLVQLATSGATTLIGAAATDAWQQARAGFARLLGRGDADKQALAARRLDALTAAVSEAAEPDKVREQMLPVWQTRLTDLLEEDPAAADLLRALRDELQERLPAPQQQWVQNVTASAPGAVAQGVVFGNIHNHPAG